MSQDNVWEWLLEHSAFQLLLKSRQRIGRRDIVRKPVPKLCLVCYCDLKRSTADGWQFERWNLQTVRSGRADARQSARQSSINPFLLTKCSGFAVISIYLNIYYSHLTVCSLLSTDNFVASDRHLIPFSTAYVQMDTSSSAMADRPLELWTF